MVGGPRRPPGLLAEIGATLPCGATSELLGTAWRGVPPDTGAVVGLVVAVLVGVLVGVVGTVRLFRWDR